MRRCGSGTAAEQGADSSRTPFLSSLVIILSSVFPQTCIPLGSMSHDPTGDSSLVGCYEPARSVQHQPSLLPAFSFLTLTDAVSFVYSPIKCSAIISSGGKPRWSKGRRTQRPTEAWQNQGSKWLQFSDDPACSTCETYSRDTLLQMSRTHPASVVIIKTCLCFLFIYTRWWLGHRGPGLFPCHPHRT